MPPNQNPVYFAAPLPAQGCRTDQPGEDLGDDCRLHLEQVSRQSLPLPLQRLSHPLRWLRSAQYSCSRIGSSWQEALESLCFIYFCHSVSSYILAWSEMAAAQMSTKGTHVPIRDATLVGFSRFSPSQSKEGHAKGKPHSAHSQIGTPERGQ